MPKILRRKIIIKNGLIKGFRVIVDRGGLIYEEEYIAKKHIPFQRKKQTFIPSCCKQAVFNRFSEKENNTVSGYTWYYAQFVYPQATIVQAFPSLSLRDKALKKFPLSRKITINDIKKYRISIANYETTDGMEMFYINEKDVIQSAINLYGEKK